MKLKYHNDMIPLKPGKTPVQRLLATGIIPIRKKKMKIKSVSDTTYK